LNLSWKDVYTFLGFAAVSSFFSGDWSMCVDKCALQLMILNGIFPSMLYVFVLEENERKT